MLAAGAVVAYRLLPARARETKVERSTEIGQVEPEGAVASMAGDGARGDAEVRPAAVLVGSKLSS